MAESAPMEFDKETLSRLEEIFRTCATPDNIVNVFNKYDRNVLTRQDIEVVNAKVDQKGDTAGAALLFDRLHRYSGWYPCLLKVLRDSNVKLSHVADFMESEVALHRPPKKRRIDTLMIAGPVEKNEDAQHEVRPSTLFAYNHCGRNPGHTRFIRVLEFKVEHLPLRYQDSDIMDWIRNWSDRTVLVKTKYCSENRPKHFPGIARYPFSRLRGSSCVRVGSGYVVGVKRYSESDSKSCVCEKCEPETVTPERIWGEIFILTTTHLIYDKKESEVTTCFFHDDHREVLKNNEAHALTNSISGFGIWYNNVREDRCIMRFITHDMEMVTKLDKLLDRSDELTKKVYNKYKNVDQTSADNTGLEHNLCVCISHPHGCEKHVSLGTWTHRTIVETGKIEGGDGRSFDDELTQYVYNTPTCPGSGGAPVLSLNFREINGKFWHGLCHPHSHRGRHPDKNKSGLNWEHINASV